MTRRNLGRRELLKAGLLAPVAASGSAHAAIDAKVRRPAASPFPLRNVRLEDSDYRRAFNLNRVLLLQLQPDRLLHGFRVQAGLPPKADAYGGWEADTIAGHTLGHYLSALSLTFAQDDNQHDDAEIRSRVQDIIAELELCQRQRPDGYLAAFTRRVDERIEPGWRAFDEVRCGNIRARPFNLNGAWSPLYNWHKLIAGLLDADRHCESPMARRVAVKLAEYIDGVFAGLDDRQAEEVLSCEYGGLNESLAELHARTGDPRWSRLALRLNDRHTLAPLQQGHAELDGLHANTLLAKMLGQARLYEVLALQPGRVASETLWTAATQHHVYACGGVGDGENFTPADSQGRHLSDRTCETCASYNMLKLTRYVHGWAPDARHFDYYERTHLNHVMAMQDPRSGMFTYMMPLAAGAPREFSDPADSFWCCFGTGMESHAKHGDSIWWHRDDELIVNLFIPSTLDWPEHGGLLALETGYPRDGKIIIRFERLRQHTILTLALRVPSWAGSAAVAVNGAKHAAERDADGYLRLRRSWRAGDVVSYDIALKPRLEALSGAPDMVAVLHGPLLLGADLGAAGGDLSYDRPSPALVSHDPLATLRLVDAATSRYESRSAGWPRPLMFRPFAFQQDRLSAPYLRCFEPQQWDAAARASLRAVPDTSLRGLYPLDEVVPGDPGSARLHQLSGVGWSPITYRGRAGWQSGAGESLTAMLRVGSGGNSLRMVYYDDDVCRRFRIVVNGVVVASEDLPGRNPCVFYQKFYRLPPAATAGFTLANIRFEPLGERGVGRLFRLEIHLDPA